MSLSPLDGRSAARVEVARFVMLLERCEFPHVRPMSAAEKQSLQDWVATFDVQQAQWVKEIEAVIRHDNVEDTLSALRSCCSLVLACCAWPSGVDRL